MVGLTPVLCILKLIECETSINSWRIQDGVSHEGELELECCTLNLAIDWVEDVLINQRKHNFCECEGVYEYRHISFCFTGQPI